LNDDKVVCPQCGSKNFWILIVATDLKLSRNSTGLTFKAYDVAVNRDSGMLCQECNYHVEAFESAWEFTAKRVNEAR
jgi:predicted nucleic-acid-binding Zn-ribbon protein